MMGSIFIIVAGLLVCSNTNAHSPLAVNDSEEERVSGPCQGRSPHSADSSQVEYDGTLACMNKISAMEERLEGRTVRALCQVENRQCDT